MNILIRLLTLLISFIPVRTLSQEPPVMKVDTHVELLDLEDLDQTQAQIDEIKKQIKEIQQRLERVEHPNPLRRIASSPQQRSELLRSTKD